MASFTYHQKAVYLGTCNYSELLAACGGPPIHMLNVDLAACVGPPIHMLDVDLTACGGPPIHLLSADFAACGGKIRTQ